MLEITDVRSKATPSADYTGSVLAEATLRLTDRDNAPRPGTFGFGTMIDTTLPFEAGCAPTADATIGSKGAVATTANAVFPGFVRIQRRAIWQLGPVTVHDGGPDATGSTRDDNTVFMRQGVFVP